jgi:hypothetical protein
MVSSEFAPSERWAWMAQVIGFNLLAKEAKTLGQKVYCRLSRDDADEQLTVAGFKSMLDRERGEILVSLNTVPRVEFHARDVELMRKAVSEHDAKQHVVPLDPPVDKR